MFLCNKNLIFWQVMIGLGPGSNLPPPPVLGNLDPVKLEEIRRTIYVGNLEDSVSHLS